MCIRDRNTTVEQLSETVKVNVMLAHVRTESCPLLRPCQTCRARIRFQPTRDCMSLLMPFIQFSATSLLRFFSKTRFQIILLLSYWPGFSSSAHNLQVAHNISPNAIDTATYKATTPKELGAVYPQTWGLHTTNSVISSITLSLFLYITCDESHNCCRIDIDANAHRNVTRYALRHSVTVFENSPEKEIKKYF